MPATPSATWDNAVLGCPELRAFQVNQRSTQREGFPIKGATRFRNIRGESFLDYEIQVPQTPTEYQAFRSFYFNDLNAGELWFNMPLLIGPEIEVLIAHIVNGFRQSRNTNVFGTYNLNFTVVAVRVPSTPYTAPDEQIRDSTSPGNPDLGTLDIRDSTNPGNPSLGTLDVNDPNDIVGKVQY